MYKLSPSDFAYLYEECKLCYYLKIKHGITQPKMPMPGVFSAINSLVQGDLIGKNLHDLSDKLPDGIVESQEGWVESKQIPDTNLFVKGKYDLLVKLGDGSHLLVDLKISTGGVDKVDKYQSQLNAYRYAFENPASGIPTKITRLGLLTFYPEEVSIENKNINMVFPPNWLEVPINNEGFLDLMKKIDTLLSGPMPEETDSCKWCQYRHHGDIWTHKEETKDEINF